MNACRGIRGAEAEERSILHRLRRFTSPGAQTFAARSRSKRPRRTAGTSCAADAMEAFE